MNSTSPPNSSSRHATPHAPLATRLASGRFWIYLAIPSLWIAVMTQLWMRESGRFGRSLLRMGVSPEVLLVSWTDYEHWLWIEQNGRRIGLTTTSIMPLTVRPSGRPDHEPPGYRMTSRTAVTFRLMGLELPVEVATQVQMNSAFELETLQAVLHAAGHRANIQAFVENQSLFYRARLGDDKTSGAASLGPNPLLGLLGRREVCGRTPLSEPIFLTDAVIPVLTRTQNLKPGQVWVTRASSPLAGLLRSDVRVAVEKKEALAFDNAPVEAWRILQQVGNMRATVWFDTHNGRLVQSDLGSGLRLLKAHPAQAVGDYPAFKRGPMFAKINREAIRTHVDPALDGKPLGELLPQIPGL